ncbi:MAG: RnfABCDGE type electron transport complex subunit D [Limnochordales bacterium]|nr:RnfABCDGE type electron transport complex subunit D [Limnochordales bacterium]
MSVTTTSSQTRGTEPPLLVLSSSPHIHSPLTAERAMYTVLATLLPVAGVSVYIFGWRVLPIVLTSVVSALIAEGVAQWARRRSPWRSLKDGSAILTGLLLALTLPASTPLWVAALGSTVAILLGKQAFGGLGHNVFNPALVGRVFLLVTFPQLLSDFSGSVRMVDTVTTATPLAAVAQGQTVPSYLELLAGYRAGALGETAAVALLLGGLILIAFRIINWRIPFGILATVAIFAWAAGQDPLFHLLSGGLILGAFYMATDWVTSPLTRLGSWIYAVGIGLITMVIRLWGSYPEGVSFAILFMNMCTPLINRYTLPRPIRASDVSEEVSARA